MLNKRFPFLILTLFAMVLSVGSVIAVFKDVIPQTGSAVLLAAVPPALMMIAAAWINYRMLIPRYFLRQRYIHYGAICFAMAMVIPLAGVAMEGMIRHGFGLSDRIHNYLSPWILVDSLSTAALLMVIFLGMALTRIYRRWKEETAVENRLAKQFRMIIDAYKRRLHPQEILATLNRIKELAMTDADKANDALRQLSTILRKELYDLPKIEISQQPPASDAPRLKEFLSAKRYALLRDICLKMLIGAVSLTAIFEASDAPSLNLDGLWSFLGMYLVISIIAYGTKSLCKHFLNRGKLRSYIWGCAVFLGIMTLGAVTVEYFTYVNSVEAASSPALGYYFISIISSFCTLGLFLGGITAFVVLHNWLRTENKVAALRTESAQSELRFLQSQINPHFLFNVLNNTGVLIYEAPQQAVIMLSQLTQMFEYQFRITDKEYVAVREDVQFIRNYLTLEKSRKSPFEFRIEASEEAMDVEIPTLLLIPFVENASKHSAGNRDIDITLALKDRSLEFMCSNLIDVVTKPALSTGGLGIANTRRRLSLLFGPDYSLTTASHGDRYRVKLSIPFRKL